MRLGMKKVDGKSPFEQKWGIAVKELAQQEGVSAEAIYMRLNNHGTPFQRSHKPTVEEIMYGKTCGELALEIGCHPVTIKKRLRTIGTIYLESAYTHSVGKRVSDIHWTEKRAYTKPSGWLHPQHPAYDMWRFIVVSKILEGKTIDVAVEEMLDEIK